MAGDGDTVSLLDRNFRFILVTRTFVRLGSIVVHPSAITPPFTRRISDKVLMKTRSR